MNVSLLVATSLDGRISTHKEQNSTDWTSKQDRDFFRSKTVEAGVLIVGRATFETIGKPLKDRRIIVMSRTEDNSTEGVEWTSEDPKNLLTRLEREGVKNVVIGGGAQIYSQFLEAGLVDELFISVHPTVFGVGTPFVKNIEKKLSFSFVSSEQWSDGTVLLHYKA